MIDLFGNITIRSLALHQPFASLMRWGKIETRTWNTSIRGRVLLYSTKSALSGEQILGSYSSPKLLESIEQKLKDDETRHLCGYALVIADLYDIRPMRPEDEEKTFVNYNKNLFCHLYTNVVILKPFEFKAPIGARKWGVVSDKNLLSELKQQGVYVGNF